jgi:hypothetical protein
MPIIELLRKQRFGKSHFKVSPRKRVPKTISQKKDWWSAVRP